MSDWDLIECGYSAADETINFGSRPIGDVDNLYESSTLATIKNSTDASADGNPLINSLINNGRIFFSINKVLKVFDSLQCSSLCYEMLFDDLIDSFCIIPDGSLLICCLRNGSAVCFVLGDTAEHLFTTSIIEHLNTEEVCFINCYLESKEGNTSFLLVTGCGKLFRLNIINTSEADKTTTELECCSSLLLDLGQYVTTSAYNYPNVLMSGAGTTVYDILADDKITDKKCGLVKAFPFSNMFVGLQDTGKLLRICSHTLWHVSANDHHIFKDFTVIQSSSGGYNILAVTKENEDGVSNVQLISNPGFEIVFSLKLTHDVHLITLEDINDEVVYIIKTTQANVLSELRFTVVYETTPEKRLERLLRKQDFDEAYKFAEKFSLDVNLIRKAKAQMIVEKDVCSKSDIDVLLDLLVTIDDKLFTMECCLDVHLCCENWEDVERVLKYGSSDVPYNVASAIDMTKYKQICDDLFRFETFKILVNNGLLEDSMDEWNDFCNCNLIYEVLSKLAYGSVKECIILYSRLDKKTLSCLSDTDVEEILNKLNNLPVSAYKPFLYVFVPVTLTHYPNMLDIFVDWLQNKIFLFEHKASSHFPENAIEFSNMVVDLLKVRCDMNVTKKLTDLSTALNHLQVLKNNFRITVPINDFLKGAEHFIRTLLNIDMDESDYYNFLNNYLYKYILDNHLQPDEIFLGEIEEFIKYDEKYWVQMVPHVLKCIKSVEMKLKAILVWMDAASVPWSENLRKIAENAMEYSHPLVDDIKKKIENHPVCVILKKYNLRSEVKSIQNLKLFINRIIKESKPTMLSDIRELCTNENKKHQANLLLIRHFIKIGEFTQALSILDGNTPEEIYSCCTEIMTYIKTIIDLQGYDLPKLQQNCYEISHSIFKRLTASVATLNIGSCQWPDEYLQAIQNSYLIKTNLGKNVTTENLLKSSKRNELLNELILEVIQDHEDGAIDITESLYRCCTISQYLREDRGKVFLDFCDKIGSFSVILQFAEAMYVSDDTSAEHLCLIAILILQHIGTSKNNLHQTLADFNETLVPQNTHSDANIFIRGLKLAGKVAAKAVLKADNWNLDACSEVFNWIDMAYFMTVSRNYVISDIFDSSFMGDSGVPACNVFDCLKNVFNIYVNFMRNYSNPNLRYLFYFSDDYSVLTEEQLTQELKHLPYTVQNLCTQGQNLTAYKLLITLQNGLVYADVNEQTDKTLANILVKQCAASVMQQVVSANKIDSDLLYNLLLMFDSTTATSYLNKAISVYKSNVTKLEIFTKAALKILQDEKDAQEDLKQLRTMLLKCKWWKKIKNCAVKYKEFFRSSPDSLVKQLLLNDHLNVALLEEFCEDFKLNVQKLYLTYLRTVLMNWKPSYGIKDAVGKRVLVLKSTADEVSEKCQPIIDKIEDKKLMISVLQSLWNHVNFYYYEVFLCLMRICGPLGNPETSKKRFLLLFLQEYRRVSKPSQAEIEQWYTAFPDTQSLDPLSEWRLPFIQSLLTSDVWNIIRPELTLNTYGIWFNAIDILEGVLNKDDICCFAVKEVVSSGLLQEGKSNHWVMQPLHKDLFDKIDDCVQNIIDIERATSVVYHLMSNTPSGADQVNAAQLCYKYALRYKRSGVPDVQKAFTKVRLKYLSFSAMHILHLNQLAEERYLRLVSQPSELIEALYLDERIVKIADTVVLHFPDINKAVDELAKLYEINVSEKRTSLLESWLSISSTFNLDSSVNLFLNCKGDVSADFAVDNMKRASYLCTSGDKDFWKNYLVDVGINDESPHSRNYYYRAKALTCFSKISDDETILKLTTCTRAELTNLISKLSLISDLHFLGYSFDVISLDALNKKELLRNISQNLGNVSNIKVMAAICMTYEIYNLKYWELIMKEANKQNMLNEIQEYLEFLTPVVMCAQKSFYKESWQRVIDYMFAKCLKSDTKHLLKLCVDNMRLVQTCPVFSSLKFNSAINTLLKVRMPEFAALLLQYVPDNEKEDYLNEILNQNKNIGREIDKLEEYGLWGISNAKNLFLKSIPDE